MTTYNIIFILSRSAPGGIDEMALHFYGTQPHWIPISADAHFWHAFFLKDLMLTQGHGLQPCESSVSTISFANSQISYQCSSTIT